MARQRRHPCGSRCAAGESLQTEDGFESVGVEFGGTRTACLRITLGKPWAGAGNGVHECLVQGGPRCEAGECRTVGCVKFGKDSGSLN